MRIMVYSLMVCFMGCASLTTLRPARVLTAGEKSGIVATSMIGKDGPILDFAGRIGLGEGFDVGIKTDYLYIPSIDMRVQLLKNPMYCNFGFGISFHGDGKSHISNLSREFIYQPSFEFGQDCWYYSFNVFHPTTSSKIGFLSRELKYIGGEFSVWNMTLGGKLNLTKTASLIAELSYVNFKSGGVIWVPAIGLQVSE